jgi:hypothetical protein
MATLSLQYVHCFRSIILWSCFTIYINDSVIRSKRCEFCAFSTVYTRVSISACETTGTFFYCQIMNLKLIMWKMLYIYMYRSWNQGLTVFMFPMIKIQDVCSTFYINRPHEPILQLLYKENPARSSYYRLILNQTDNSYHHC